MAYKITLANSTALLDQAFKLRHHVFVEQEGLLQATADGRYVDRFDAYPTTRTFVATMGEKVIGTFRVALDSSEGLPADQYYDFRKHVPEDSRLIHTGFFCVSQEHRSPGLNLGLMLMSAYFADSHEVTHICAPINPKLANLSPL